MEKIAALINDRKIDGVSDLRDESDRRGIRVVIELKRGTMPEIVINSLYKYTPLETSFGINMLAVVDNRPVLLNLKTALTYFLDHRREVVVRRTKFELRKAEARAHILEGLLKALDHIDEVVSLIRSSATPPEAKERLMQRFELSEVQAQAILDMRLQRLTGLERGKIEEELRDLLSKIAWYQSILGDAPCSGASSVMKWNTSSRPIRRPAVRKSSARRFRTSTSKICCPTMTWSSPCRAVATSSARASASTSSSAVAARAWPECIPAKTISCRNSSPRRTTSFC